MSPLNLLPGAINEIIVSVSDTGSLSLLDRYGLMAAIMDESIEEEERLSIDRLLRSISRGRVQVANS
jgi:hypothetical protein